MKHITTLRVFTTVIGVIALFNLGMPLDVSGQNPGTNSIGASVGLTAANENPNSKLYYCGVDEHEAYLRSIDSLYDQKKTDGEEQVRKIIGDLETKKTAKGEIPFSKYVIPIVVHVVYKNSTEDVSDALVISMIEQLNADFSHTNSDAGNTPSYWQSVAADMQISFCLAIVDPNGNPTTGIIHVPTSMPNFGLNYGVQFAAQGGDDAWDVNKYFNIWICDLGPNNSLFGYAEYPLSPIPATYGAVIDFCTVGSLANPNPSGICPNHAYGRTLSHEVGHNLNLIHIWGSGTMPYTCLSDNVSDTPSHGTSTTACPSGVVLGIGSCGVGLDGSPDETVYPGKMYQNPMDYTDDLCKNFFTVGQRTRAQATILSHLSSLVNNAGTVCACVLSPAISSDPGPATTLCPGQSVYISASGGLSYLWNTGSTSAFIVASPTVTTAYFVTVTDASGCTGTASVTFIVDPNCNATGISQLNGDALQIGVWPNPSNGKINLKANPFENLKIESIEIYNVFGEKIYPAVNFQINKSSPQGVLGTNFQIDLSSQPGGIYFLRISMPSGQAKTGKEILYEKIIIQK
ncbi:MAG: hypothetical protein EPN85_02125 [Bacteroidetes bacterium]|nr:MAG: hypothetical protein EPN85_02125 [Bacteroidota bacterium]